MTISIYKELLKRRGLAKIFTSIIKTGETILFNIRYHTRRSIVTEQSRLHDVSPSRHITTACLYADFRDRSDELECDPRFRGQTRLRKLISGTAAV
jgi:hypothetical protein